MAKLFLSFFNAVPKVNDLSGAPPYYEGFIKGAASAGNEILVFQSDRPHISNRSSSKIRHQLESALKKFSPDVVVAFNNYGPQYSDLVDCPIVVYGVDSPRNYYNNDEIVKHSGRFRYITYAQTEVSVLQEDFGIDGDLIKVVPFFTEVRAEKLEKKIPISFIGSRFANKNYPWREFRRNSADYSAAKRYLQLLNHLRTQPYAAVDKINEAYRDLGLKESDYAGILHSLAAEKRIQVLSCVADLGLLTFGTEEWFSSGGECADLYCSYNPNRIYTLKQNQDLYNSSKICLNVNHIYTIEGFSWRVCDIMASSGCLVSEWTPYLERRFPNVPIPTFRNKYEAHEQCAKILKDDKLREEIVAASNQIIDEHYRFRHILPIIEESAGMSLHSDKPGSVEFLDIGKSTTASKPRTRFQVTCDVAKLLMAQFSFRPHKAKERKLLSRIDKYYNVSESFVNARRQMWKLED